MCSVCNLENELCECQGFPCECPVCKLDTRDLERAEALYVKYLQSTSDKIHDKYRV